MLAARNTHTSFATYAQHQQLAKYRDEADPKRNWNETLQFHFQHARERTQERFGFYLTPQDWERLNWVVFREIEGVSLVSVKNEDTTVYDVEFTPWNGRMRTIRVFFSELFYCVTTIVPINDEYHYPNVWSDLLKKRRLIRYEHGKAMQEATTVANSPFKAVTPVALASPVVAAPDKPMKAKASPKLVVTAANVEEVATNLWASLSGADAAAKSALMGDLIKYLKVAEKASTPKKTRRKDVSVVLAKIINQPLSKLAAVSVLICDEPMLIGSVFKIADRADHPMHQQCKAFVETHRLYLKSVAGDRGKAAVRVLQREAA